MSEKIKNAPIAVVTGANGFVGSHLVELLLEKGYHVKCIVRKTSNLRWIAALPVDLYDCGLTDVAELRKVFEGAAYIFHIAGAVSVKKREMYYTGNVDMTRNVLDAAEGIVGLKKILVTSSLAASAPAVAGAPVTEDTPSAPVSMYGKSKLEQEKVTRTYMDRLPVVIVRPPVVYGPRETEVLLLFKTIKMRLMALVGFGEKYLSLVYVRDLVEGMLLAATSERTTGEVYFLGSRQAEYTHTELNETVADVLGVRPMRIRVPHGVLYVAGGVSQFLGRFASKPPTLHLEKVKEMTCESWSCSSEKAIQKIGYQPNTTLQEGLEITIDWYRKEGWL